jgi:hypothetical protein
VLLPRTSIVHSAADFAAVLQEDAALDRLAAFNLMVLPGISAGVDGNTENPVTYASGRSWENGALLGYALVWRRISIVGLVGPTQIRSINNGVGQTQSGVRANVALDMRPTDATRFESSLNYLTIQNAYQLKAKIGLKIPGEIYFGPEARVSTQNVSSGINTITESRIGLHLSSLKVGPLYLGFSGGIAYNRQVGRGGYCGINVYGSF